MTDPKEDAAPEAPDEKAPESDKGKDKGAALASPEVMYWRWSKADRELFLRVKAMLKITSNTDVLRFALGAAERELARSGAGRSS